MKDFAPISRVGAASLALVVTSGLAAKDVRDLIDLTHAKPGVSNFASSGTGSIPHLAVELIKTMAGVNIVHVPYQGSGPAMTDVMGGQIHYRVLHGGAERDGHPHNNAGGGMGQAGHGFAQHRHVLALTRN